MKRQLGFLVRALIFATLLVSGIALAQDGVPQSAAEPAVAAPAEALGTGFTYQGRLDKDGTPVNDTCDMNFKLYDAASLGSQVGSTINMEVPVVDGLFTVTLDFGPSAFDGERRWLGIEVDCEEDGTYVGLGRQELTAAPYALYANSVPWDGLTDVPVDFVDGVDDDTTYTAGFGLILDETTFDVVTSTIQLRVTGACDVGYAIRQVNADGTVTCEQDDDTDTTYSAGAGLALDGTTFAVVTTTVQQRVMGACGSGYAIRQIDVDGSVTCEPISPGSSYANVVVVAQSGGDYASVQAAIDSITDATVSNPYLVWVAPGVYSETVTMKSYVHLQGAGEEATILSSIVTNSSWPPSQATLKLVGNTSLRDLTVNNGGTGTYNVALMVLSSTTRTPVANVTARAQGSGTDNHAVYLTGSGTGVITLQHVTGLAENGSDENFGLYSRNGARVVLRDSSFTGRGGDDAYSIYSRDSGTMLEAEGVTALAENGSDTSYGLYNDAGADVVLRGDSFTARGGSGTYDAYGIYNDGSGTTLEAEGVTALAEDSGTHNYGLYNGGGAGAVLRGGSFTGRGGSYAYGIWNQYIGTRLKATGIVAIGEDATFSYGLYSNNTAIAEIDGSRLIGSSYSLFLYSGTVRLGVTQLDGGVGNSYGTLTCFQVYDENYAGFTCP